MTDNVQPPPRDSGGAPAGGGPKGTHSIFRPGTPLPSLNPATRIGSPEKIATRGEASPVQHAAGGPLETGSSNGGTDGRAHAPSITPVGLQDTRVEPISLPQPTHKPAYAGKPATGPHVPTTTGSSADAKPTDRHMAFPPERVLSACLIDDVPPPAPGQQMLASGLNRLLDDLCPGIGLSRETAGAALLGLVGAVRPDITIAHERIGAPITCAQHVTVCGAQNRLHTVFRWICGAAEETWADRTRRTQVLREADKREREAQALRSGKTLPNDSTASENEQRPRARVGLVYVSKGAFLQSLTHSFDGDVLAVYSTRGAPALGISDPRGVDPAIIAMFEDSFAHEGVATADGDTREVALIGIGAADPDLLVARARKPKPLPAGLILPAADLSDCNGPADGTRLKTAIKTIAALPDNLIVEVPSPLPDFVAQAAEAMRAELSALSAPGTAPAAAAIIDDLPCRVLRLSASAHLIEHAVSESVTPPGPIMAETLAASARLAVWTARTELWLMREAALPGPLTLVLRVARVLRREADPVKGMLSSAVKARLKKYEEIGEEIDEAVKLAIGAGIIDKTMASQGGRDGAWLRLTDAARGSSRPTFA
ncbi:hypothetical protein [Salinarimonas ramus]|uniref:Uncharacterized protein n=1 Tax=Salinarimonas ramus TaxID=690164 RepID=A0A917QEZ7_9HYPH|nr:hypothetical protein [Salinarimonas ramus]GGK47302.1 hypothetical protein GCM10011322_37980 [Salinarimonas ramus]